MDKMQRLGKAKIGRLSAKGIEYPQLRLLRVYSSVVGTTADIYATEYGGKQAFLVVTGNVVSKENMVLKPNEEVLKLADEKAVKSRLSDLESEINELKSSFFKNKSAMERLKGNEAQDEWARRNSNPRSPPCEYGGI
jgi:hypothetical protein